MKSKKKKKKKLSIRKKKYHATDCYFPTQLYLRRNGCSHKPPKCGTRMSCFELYSIMVMSCGLIYCYVYRTPLCELFLVVFHCTGSSHITRGDNQGNFNSLLWRHVPPSPLQSRQTIPV